MTVVQELDWLRHRLLKLHEQATFNQIRGIA
jgi:hypothetical protein